MSKTEKKDAQHILEVTDLCVEFRDKTAVDHVSFHVDAGEIVGIIGESGSGKSVSALSVMNLLAEDAEISGEVRFQGKVLNTVMEKRHSGGYQGKDISMVFQEPMTSLNPLMKIGDQLEEMLHIHGLPEKVQLQNGSEKTEETAERPAAQLRRQLVLDTMKAAGLSKPEELLSCYPHELSGGMRQRVMIAMALICHPALMIADEPTTALDVKLQDQILELLKHVNEQRNMAVLFISHNMSIVQNFCHRVYVMQKGKIVEEGTPDSIFYHPKEAYTKQLIASIPDGTPREDTCPSEALPVLEVKDYSVYYPKKKKHFYEKGGRVQIVKNVSFQIRQGELLGLVGQSGCGKSTLCNGILGLQKDTSGTVTHFTEYPQMVFQDPYSSLNPRKKIGWILKEPLHRRKDLNRKQKDEMVLDILKRVGLKPEVADRYPRELSGGMRQRVSIAIALIQGSKFIIADEPVSALDVTIQKQILELFLEIQRETGLACLFISHDMKVVRQMCHRILEMKDGQLYQISE